MTMEYLNQLIDASLRGTLIGITLFCWGFSLVAIWKWILNITKKFLHWAFPSLFKHKASTDDTYKN